jgi:hypothetical protein
VQKSEWGLKEDGSQHSWSLNQRAERHLGFHYPFRDDFGFIGCHAQKIIHTVREIWNAE